MGTWLNLVLYSIYYPSTHSLYINFRFSHSPRIHFSVSNHQLYFAPFLLYSPKYIFSITFSIYFQCHCMYFIYPAFLRPFNPLSSYPIHSPTWWPLTPEHYTTEWSMVTSGANLQIQDSRQTRTVALMKYSQTFTIIWWYIVMEMFSWAVCYNTLQYMTLLL